MILEAPTAIKSRENKSASFAFFLLFFLERISVSVFSGMYRIVDSSLSCFPLLSLLFLEGWEEGSNRDGGWRATCFSGGSPRSAIISSTDLYRSVALSTLAVLSDIPGFNSIGFCRGFVTRRIDSTGIFPVSKLYMVAPNE